MLRARRFATPAVLLALGLAVAGAGCGSVDPALLDASTLPENLKVLRLELPSFEEGRIQGIWMWRRSEVDGGFEPVSEIRLLGIATDQGQEYLEYRLMDPSGNPLDLVLSAAIARTGSSAVVSLWFLRFAEPGAFKASVYNAVGDSGLSEQTIDL
jgi:hypothetical protein